jgi:8-oxo-dGTP diphosphatase
VGEKDFGKDMSDEKRPKVGVGVFVLKDGKFLMQKRKGKHGDGDWSLPGGHLEFGETPEECATREVLEETSVSISNIRRGPYTNDYFEAEGKHYITLFIISDYGSGEPAVKEPETTEELGWFDMSDMPEPKFLPLANLLKTGYDPFRII